jgi:hypothetical protein
MPRSTIQEWLAFALLGVALFASGLAPALPSTVAGDYIALGVLLLFASSVGMFMTSPTVTEYIQAADRWIERATND